MLQPGSITRTFALVLALAAVEQPAAQPASGVTWQDAPAYVALFTPPSHAPSYRTATSPSDVPTILNNLSGDSTLEQAPGAWTSRSQSALDAFGKTGPYDRWKLARLYGSRQATVVRGTRRVGDGPSESWTLISPYPDPRLERLESGTLLIVLRLP